MNQLLFWRRPGTYGPFYAHLGRGAYAHTTGNAFGPDGPLSASVRARAMDRTRVVTGAKNSDSTDDDGLHRGKLK